MPTPPLSDPPPNPSPRPPVADMADRTERIAALLAEASHELSNPLAIVTAHAELLALEAEGTVHAGRAVAIRDAADRAARIARRFLAAVRDDAATPGEPAAVAAMIGGDPHPDRAARTALVVDDEVELADALADLLSVLGYCVTAVASGAAAQAHLSERNFDLVVSDLRMPGIDGPALFDWIATVRPAMRSAVAFSTGDTLSAAAARFLGEAERPFMEKPFTLDAVRALVAAVEARR